MSPLLWSAFFLSLSFVSGSVGFSFKGSFFRIGLPSVAGEDSFGAAILRRGLPSAALGDSLGAISSATLFPRCKFGEFGLLPFALRFVGTREEFCLLLDGEEAGRSSVVLFGVSSAVLAKLTKARAWA